MRKIMSIVVGCLAWVSHCGMCADAKDKEAVAKDLEQLKGNWECIRANINCKVQEKPTLRMTIEGTNLFLYDKDKIPHKRTFLIEPSRNPKEIDIASHGMTNLGIYKLEGDALTIALAPKAGAARSTNFEGKDEGVVLVFRRSTK